MSSPSSRTQILIGSGVVCSRFRSLGSRLSTNLRMEANGMKAITIFALAILAVFVSSRWARQPGAHAETSPYPAMAPLDQYLMSDSNAEIALARTAAPKSVSEAADVMVLGRNGYTSAVKGSNGFLCLVERSWGSPTDDPDFW